MLLGKMSIQQQLQSCALPNLQLEIFCYAKH